MSELATILLIVIPIVLPSLLALLTFLVKRAFEGLPSNARPLILDMVTKAVAATEQQATNVLSDPEKKQFALARVQEQLDHAGLKVPVDVLNTLVEAAVYAMNHAAPILPAAAPQKGA